MRETMPSEMLRFSKRACGGLSRAASCAHSLSRTFRQLHHISGACALEGGDRHGCRKKLSREDRWFYPRRREVELIVTRLRRREFAPGRL